MWKGNLMRGFESSRLLSLAILSVAILLCAFPHSAFAGHWEVSSYVTSGESSVNDSGYTHEKKTATADMVYTVQAKLRWVSDAEDGSDALPPFDRVYLYEAGSVHVISRLWHNVAEFNDDWHGSYYNVYPSELTTTNSLPNTLSGYGNEVESHTSRCAWTTINVPEGATEVLGPVRTFTGKAKISTIIHNNQVSISASASASYTATAHDKPYIAKQGLYGPNYRKAGDGVKEENKRERDGSMTIDLVASKDLYWVDGYGFEYDFRGRYTGSGSFQLFQNVFEHSIIEWQASPSPAHFTENPVYYLWNLGPSSASLSGELGQTTQVSALLSKGSIWFSGPDPNAPTIPVLPFKIRWHYEHENVMFTGQQESNEQEQDIEPDEPGYAYGGAGGGIGYKWTSEFPYWAPAQKLLSGAFGVIGNWDSTPSTPVNLALVGLMAALELSADEHAPKEIRGNADMAGCWGKEGSTYTVGGVSGNNPPPNANMNHWTMVPRLKVGYTIKFFKGDTYTGYGYVGVKSWATKKFNGILNIVGDFTYNDGENFPGQ